MAHGFLQALAPSAYRAVHIASQLCESILVYASYCTSPCTDRQLRWYGVPDAMTLLAGTNDVCAAYTPGWLWFHTYIMWQVRLSSTHALEL